jgi:C1A family cysteine protease
VKLHHVERVLCPSCLDRSPLVAFCTLCHGAGEVIYAHVGQHEITIHPITDEARLRAQLQESIMTAIQPRDNHYYGYIPDLPDHRDHVLQLAPHELAATPPEEVHLQHSSPFQFPIYDQGELGSCVGNATAAAMQYLLRKQHLPNFTPSRLAIYYGARKIEGTIGSDAGCMVRDAITVVAQEGVAPEQFWPYIPQRFRDAPDQKYDSAAIQHQALEYARVRQTRMAIQQALAAGHPIITGISVFDSFESDAVATTGTVPLPAPTEQLQGGHAILLVGYSADRVEVRNSWGKDWGDKGYFTLPWDYVLSPDLAEDFWVIRLIEG